MKLCWSLIVLTILLGSTGTFGKMNHARAAESDQPWVSKIVSIQGRVAVKRPGDNDWRPVRLDDTLFAGDQIRVDANSRAGIVLRNDAVLRLDQNTILTFTEIEEETTFIFRLLKGAANFFSRRPRSLKILTPFVNGVVEGTEFLVQVDEDRTRIDLFEGRLLAFNAQGEVQLTPGQGATAVAGKAPKRRLLAQPRDSVQWALYYPPVLVLGERDVPKSFQMILEAYSKGQVLQALTDMERIDEGLRNNKYYVLRAALRLHNGNISQAQEDISQSLIANPDNSEAFALQSIISVVQNRKAEAMRLAQKAVELDPGSAAAQLALSYAYQAAFDLPNALESAQRALIQSPDNSTAYARLAELYLSIGRLDSGEQTAHKAVKLNPNISHAHALLKSPWPVRLSKKPSFWIPQHRCHDWASVWLKFGTDNWQRAAERLRSQQRWTRSMPQFVATLGKPISMKNVEPWMKCSLKLPKPWIPGIPPHGYMTLFASKASIDQWKP
ncbi:MAG: FecR domain-containing protein [Desulfobacteraceae bacterium]